MAACTAADRERDRKKKDDFIHAQHLDCLERHKGKSIGAPLEVAVFCVVSSKKNWIKMHNHVAQHGTLEETVQQEPGV